MHVLPTSRRTLFEAVDPLAGLFWKLRRGSWLKSGIRCAAPARQFPPASPIDLAKGGRGPRRHSQRQNFDKMVDLTPVREERLRSSPFGEEATRQTKAFKD